VTGKSIQLTLFSSSTISFVIWDCKIHVDHSSISCCCWLCYFLVSLLSSSLVSFIFNYLYFYASTVSLFIFKISFDSLLESLECHLHYCDSLWICKRYLICLSGVSKFIVWVVELCWALPFSLLFRFQLIVSLFWVSSTLPFKPKKTTSMRHGNCQFGCCIQAKRMTRMI
jgi:hypothetical protein